MLLSRCDTVLQSPIMGKNNPSAILIFFDGKMVVGCLAYLKAAISLLLQQLSVGSLVRKNNEQRVS